MQKPLTYAAHAVVLLVTALAGACGSVEPTAEKAPGTTARPGFDDADGAANSSNPGSSNDAAALDASTADASGPNATSPSARRMFLSGDVPADFGGEAGGNAVCAAAAAAAKLGGTWKALLGATRAQALAKFSGPGPFVAVDDKGKTKVIFADRAGLDAVPLETLDVDALGAKTYGTLAWTGIGHDCKGWTSVNEDDDGTITDISPDFDPDFNDHWSDVGTFSCVAVNALVCLEQ